MNLRDDSPCGAAGCAAMKDLKDQLNRIEVAIVGDEAMGTKGLAQRVADQDDRLGKIEGRLILWEEL